MQALQQLGFALDFKSKGYVIAIFTAFNSSQSVLLDYTRIGEVVQFKALDPEDVGDDRSPYSSMDDKSPYSSLTEVVRWSADKKVPCCNICNAFVESGGY